MKLLIVYHSQSGNTKSLAEAVEKGAKKANAEVICRFSREAKEDDFLWADVFAFGSPDYFSYMAGGLKDVFDRVFYQVKNEVEGKFFGVFVTHGGGGMSAAESVRELVSSAFRLREKVKPLLIQGKPDEEGLKRGEDFGRKLVS